MKSRKGGAGVVLAVIFLLQRLELNPRENHLTVTCADDTDMKLTSDMLDCG